MKHYTLNNLLFDGKPDDEFVFQITSLFLEEGKKHILMIGECINDGEFQEIKFSAHKLKSNCRLFGVERSAEALEKLETLSKNGCEDKELLNNILDSVVDELTIVFEELEEDVLRQ